MEKNINKCPLCGNKGKPVSSKTIKSLVKPERLSSLKTPEGFYFCGAPECKVAYFNPGTGELIETQDVKVVIYQKSNDPERPVCYCFNHTVKEIIEDFRKHGRSTVVEDISSKCSSGKAHCEETNPQGSCCLGNIQKLLNDTFRTTTKIKTKCCCSGTSSQNQCCQG